MGKLIGPPLTDAVVKFISTQHLFFVASAPLSAGNHVNVSPKSAGMFRVINPQQVTYLDYTGSGAETAAHLLENGRLTIMFVALQGSPRIVRLFGTGRIVLPRDLFNKPENRNLREAFGYTSMDDWPTKDGARCLVVLDITRATVSCGFSIPVFEFVKDRKTLLEYAHQTDIEKYCLEQNSLSIDGMRSLGQLITRDVPTKITEKQGWLLSEYGGSGPRAALARLVTRIRMAYAAGITGPKRDIILLFTGIAFGAMVSRARTK